MTNVKNYVIIGNGTAAIACIEGIRSVDKDGHITVVSKENHSAYCRPLISYYLEGKTDLERIKYRTDNFYAENSCSVEYGKTAEHIDIENKRVVLDDGTSLDYDALCTATGSYPFVPPVEGLDGVKEKYTFMTLDDTLALEKAVNKNTRVLIIGAGLIGLKCAEGLHGRAAEITVCDLADRVLSSILDEESAAVVRHGIEQNGVKFILGTSVKQFSKNTAVMQNGESVDFDVLVTAVGVRPDTSLINEIGGKCTRGIIVDEYMRTSIPDIFAAGDCTESVDISDGKTKIMALMPNAYMQGHCAGVNMAGGSEKFDNAIPMNSIGFFGQHIMTAGSRTENVYEEKGGSTVRKLYTDGDRLVGFMLVGNVDRAGIYTDMIRMKTPVSSVNFEILKKTPELFAFDEKNRRKKLGGVV